MSSPARKQVLWYALLWAALVITDQVLKLFSRGLAVGEQIPLIPNVLSFTHVQNTGLIWGLGQGSNPAMIWLSIFFLGVLIYYYDEFATGRQRILYVLLLAGIVGNLIDRAMQGHVTDMFDLGWWPVFNIADSCLVVGVIGLVIDGVRPSAKSNRHAATEGDAAHRRSSTARPRKGASTTPPGSRSRRSPR